MKISRDHGDPGSFGRRAERVVPGAGFTLIELLVVMAIIAMLAGLGIVGIPKLMQRKDKLAATNFINSLAGALEAYKTSEGAYPPTSLEGFPGVGPLANNENVGIEAVVLCMNSRGYNGSYSFDDGPGSKLENLDADSTQVQLTRFGDKQLWEILDPWGTPYVYFNAHDYAAALSNPETFGKVSGCDEKAKPWVNPKLKQPYKRDSFQLISAGPDRKFNTEDDITNFDRE